MSHALGLGLPVGAEWIVIAALGLLVFGKRLPEIGKSLGKGILEFKRGMKGVELDAGQFEEDPAPPRLVEKTTAVAKFDPMTGKPLAE